ncbi:MAG: signal peptidase I [Anaerolineales bacterium]|nr:signal peptidase I [Anaerolineales bacterium]
MNNFQRLFGKVVRFIIREILTTLIPALILAFLLTHFVGERVVVYSQSMEPNLHEEQQIIVEKVSCYFQVPERGDIVIVDLIGEEIPLIKRVIGLPEEVLEIKNNQVFINGQGLIEPYLAEATQRDFGPVYIPAEHVFVMGDNRNNSRDSRMIGPVPLEWIKAKAWISVWPVEDIRIFDTGQKP